MAVSTLLSFFFLWHERTFSISPAHFVRDPKHSILPSRLRLSSNSGEHMEAFDALPTPSIKHALIQSQERFPQQMVEMAKLLVSLIGFRDQYTTSHSARVANYVRLIAAELHLTD